MAKNDIYSEEPPRGAFNIVIKLFRNRALSGGLYLYNSGGREIFSCAARGKADNQRANKEDNQLRDPTKPYGDAPAGGFHQTRVVMFDQPHQRIGKGWIPIKGDAGDALSAVNNKRTGLGIHAGRGDEALIATYGCIRILDADFDHLASVIGTRAVNVYVIDI